MIELEINLKYNGKVLFGCAPVNKEEFELLKRQDRWDLERYLRKILSDLGHGLTNQIYLEDKETVMETVRGQIEEASRPSTAEVTKLIESLPLITHEPLIGNPDRVQEG